MRVVTLSGLGKYVSSRRDPYGTTPTKKSGLLYNAIQPKTRMRALRSMKGLGVGSPELSAAQARLRDELNYYAAWNPVGDQTVSPRLTALVRTGEANSISGDAATAKASATKLWWANRFCPMDALQGYSCPGLYSYTMPVMGVAALGVLGLVGYGALRWWRSR